jgi:hypothetical protein
MKFSLNKEDKLNYILFHKSIHKKTKKLLIQDKILLRRITLIILNLNYLYIQIILPLINNKIQSFEFY